MPWVFQTAALQSAEHAQSVELAARCADTGSVAVPAGFWAGASVERAEGLPGTGFCVSRV